MIAASRVVTPRSVGAINMIPAISKHAGTKHIMTAGRPTCLNSSTFRARPARSSMIINAICLSSTEMFSSDGANRSRPYGPRMMPEINMPRSAGRRNLLSTYPRLSPRINR